MPTLIKPEVKIKIASFDKSTYQLEERSKNSKSRLDFKFYQTLLVILCTSCAFLIFPESPQDSEILCKKYNSSEACLVW